MDISTKIQILSTVKTILNDDIVKDDHDIQQIYELVVKYIDSNCQHNIITDYIDISPDIGYNIHYCDICMKTFQTVKDCK
jgi:hypothetical protein